MVIMCETDLESINTISKPIYFVRLMQFQRLHQFYGGGHCTNSWTYYTRSLWLTSHTIIGWFLYGYKVFKGGPSIISR